ncbi:hypothetical protein [Nisaea sp.]|jgi:ABC-type xylose transport system permease subunit|nr:hypothetical protein [Nisaea sp.]
MKAFISSLVGIAVFSGIAWFVLGQLDFSTSHVNQSATGSVRLE